VPEENLLAPLHVFRFQVDFEEDPISPGSHTRPVVLCSGAFAECTGLEATMEPKVIKEGGRNYGAAQRAGPVTFATVVLKRGITPTRHLWQWFELATKNHGYAHRLNATITLMDAAGDRKMRWKLKKALPIKFKSPDLNAKGSEVGVEELHLAHEGLELVDPNRE
jgi:phage tail-like protein